MLEQTTKTVNGEERLAVRWGSDGTAYACSPDGDCADAARKALEWARDNGVPQGEIERGGTLLLSDRDDNDGGWEDVGATADGRHVQARAVRSDDARRRMTAR